jgi:hypothetical protein
MTAYPDRTPQEGHGKLPIIVVIGRESTAEAGWTIPLGKAGADDCKN